MIHVDFEGHGHEVWSELRNGPNNGEAFQLGGGVGFLCLVEGARRSADDALLAFPDLSEDSRRGLQSTRPYEGGKVS